MEVVQDWYWTRITDDKPGRGNRIPISIKNRVKS